MTIETLILQSMALTTIVMLALCYVEKKLNNKENKAWRHGL